MIATPGPRCVRVNDEEWHRDCFDESQIEDGLDTVEYFGAEPAPSVEVPER